MARTAPRVIEGDGRDVVPGIVDSVPRDALPCVFHTHATYQMRDEWRQRFAALLADLGRRRDLVHISLVRLKNDLGPQLHTSQSAAPASRTRPTWQIAATTDRGCAG